MQVVTGSYTGDGNDSRSITNIGFQPDLVIIFRDDSATAGVWRSSAHSGDDTSLFGGSGNETDNIWYRALKKSSATPVRLECHRYGNLGKFLYHVMNVLVHF